MNHPQPERSRIESFTGEDADLGTCRLLRQAKGKDRSALAALVARHYEFIERAVRRLRSERVRRAYDTIDCAQDVALELVEYLPDNLDRLAVEDGQAFRRLLRRIIANTLHDLHHHLAAKRRALDAEALRLDDPALDLDAPDAAAQQPEDAAASRELAEWLRLAMLFLDPADQALILRRVVACQPWASLAEALETTPDAARMRLARAERRLAACFRRVQGCSLDELVAMLRRRDRALATDSAPAA